MSDCQTVYITGTGRSGTNVLKEIFSLHPDVSSLPFEYRFTVDPRGVLEFYNTFPTIWTPYWVDAKLKDFEEFLLSLAEKPEEFKTLAENETPAPYQGWELNKWIPGYSSFVNELIADLTEFKYQARWPGTRQGIVNNEMYFVKSQTKADLKTPLSQFLEKCFDSINKNQGKQVFVEDNTHSLLFASDLMDLTPHSKMIHMVRDPRDVIASLINQRWAPRNLEQCIQWYKQTMNRWICEREKISSDFYLEIRFEDLVNDIETTLNSICNEVKMDVVPNMVNFDLSANNIGRFRKQFNTREIETLNSQLRAHLKEFDYI